MQSSAECRCTDGKEEAPDGPGSDKDPAEDNEGQRLVGAGKRDELGQKGQEKQGYLGIEYVGKRALPENLAQTGTMLLLINYRGGLGTANELNPLVNQVYAAKILQNGEGGGRRSQDGGQAKGAE